MNRYTTHVLIALSILTGIITTAPTYASTIEQEACPDCPEEMTAEEIQMARLNEIPVRIWTDSDIYEYGSDILLQGIVSNLKEGVPVTVKVTGPQGNVVRIAQVEVSGDRTFEIILSTAGNLWKQNGIYTIKAQYGPQEIKDSVTIELIGGQVQEVVSACSGNEITVRSQTDAYCVPFNAIDVTVTKATVSSTDFSITLMIDAESDGTLTLEIPRDVLDSQSDEGDSPFIVLVDGEDADAFEVESTGTTRTLEIMIPEGASKVEIIGTFAVPEFGTMAAIILAVAIVSIIAVSARSRLSILPKY
jgi:predicted secreted protein with PEFG-CTERM motif